MPEYFVLIFISISFILIPLSYSEEKWKWLFFSTLTFSCLVIWFTFYCFQPWRIKGKVVKEVNLIENVQMIIYKDLAGTPKLVNLNEKFSMVLPEYSRIKVSFLDDGSYLGIVPDKRNRDLVEILKLGDKP